MILVPLTALMIMLAAGTQHDSEVLTTMRSRVPQRRVMATVASHGDLTDDDTNLIA